VLHFSRTQEDGFAFLVRRCLDLEQSRIDTLAAPHGISKNLFHDL